MAIVTVGGPPGSGTSTVCRELSARIGWKYVYAGEIFRRMAKEKDMSLNEFSELCEKDPSVDKELDDRMLNETRYHEDVILEGRMIGPLCSEKNIPSFRVYIDASTEIRAARVNERDGGDLETVITKMKERQDSESKRYLKYYGIDPADTKYYNLIIDSSDISPEEEVDLIIAKLEGRK